MKAPGPAGPPRAAIYIRVSSVGQEEEGTSLQTQEERCRAYVTEHGYALDEANVYRDTFSGAELDERPGIQQLLEAIRARSIDVAVSYAVDRLSRDQIQLAVIVYAADRAGVRLEFVTEVFDDSAVGRFIRSAQSFVSEVERAKIIERTTRGKRARVKAGKLLPSAKPLYGYQWNADRSGYLVDPLTAPVVQRVFRSVAAGMTLRSLAAALTEEGVPTPTGAGSRWWPSVLSIMLDNPAYAGRAAGFRYQLARAVNPTSRGKSNMRLRPEADQIALPAGTVPAIVDEDVWAACRAQRQRNQEMSLRNNQHPELALLRAGHARCGYCGATMVVSDVKRGARYQCGHSFGPKGRCPGGGSTSIAVGILDQAVWEKVSAVLRDPKIIAEEVERTRADDPTTERIDVLDREMGEVAKREAALVDNLSLVTGVAAQAVAEKLNSLDGWRQHIRAERQQIMAQREQWEQARRAMADIERWCKRVAVNLDDLTYPEKRLALESLSVRAKVWKQGHNPRYEIAMEFPLDASFANGTTR